MDNVRKLPSLKRSLLKLHQDLDRVIAGASCYFSYDDLSDREVLILLLEDRRYFEHRGIDWRSMLRELLKAAMRRRHGGASTIDMQFVRTKTGFKERTIKRKLYEMLLAYFLQYRMGKLAILRSYLSVVYLGHGIKGIDEAARQIFGKSSWELELNENAMIAAMMVYPHPNKPNPRWREKMDRRAQYGLELFAKFAHRYKQRLD